MNSAVGLAGRDAGARSSAPRHGIRLYSDSRLRHGEGDLGAISAVIALGGILPRCVAVDSARKATIVTRAVA